MLKCCVRRGHKTNKNMRSELRETDTITLQISSTPDHSSSNVEFIDSTGDSRRQSTLFASSPVASCRSPDRPPNLRLCPSTPSYHDSEDETHNDAHPKHKYNPGMKLKRKLISVELIACVCSIGVFISSLTVYKLHTFKIWDLLLWKWCVLMFSVFCGRLLAEGFITLVAFLIESKILFNNKDMLYYVYGLKKSGQAFIWSSFVLLVWGLLFTRGVKRTSHASKVVNYVTRFLGSCLAGVSIWVLKTFFVKLLAASFYVSKFFDRIQESISQQYVFTAVLGPRFLTTLSGPPLMEIQSSLSMSPTNRLNFPNLNGRNEEKIEDIIDINKLKILKHDKISAWTMQGLINMITNMRLTIASGNLDDDENELFELEITSEGEAKAAAYRIFRNVAPPGCKYIDECDLLRMMTKKEVNVLLSVIDDAAETGKIRRSDLEKWLVNTFKDRELLVKSLKGSMAAIENLNKLASLVMFLIIIIVGLLVMGFLTFQVLVIILSQIILVSFMFGNTAKSIFESVIFVFVIHPFDVGNQCSIDGEQMIVDEINILTTVFVKQDGKKIYYPNSVLINKPITNFHGSIDTRDSVEFDVSAPAQTIRDLKEKVKEYLKQNSKYWNPQHTMQVKKIEDEHKMSMVLHVDHNLNIHNFGEKNKRRSKLVEDLKKIFEELGIACHLML